MFISQKLLLLLVSFKPSLTKDRDLYDLPWSYATYICKCVFIGSNNDSDYMHPFDTYLVVDSLARKLEELEAIMYETLHDYFDLCQQEGVFDL